MRTSPPTACSGVSLAYHFPMNGPLGLVVGRFAALAGTALRVVSEAGAVAALCCLSAEPQALSTVRPIAPIAIVSRSLMMCSSRLGDWSAPTVAGCESGPPWTVRATRSSGSSERSRPSSAGGRSRSAAPSSAHCSPRWCWRRTMSSRRAGWPRRSGARTPRPAPPRRCRSTYRGCATSSRAAPRGSSLRRRGTRSSSRPMPSTWCASGGSSRRHARSSPMAARRRLPISCAPRSRCGEALRWPISSSNR